MPRKARLQEVVAKTRHDMRGSRDSTVWEYMDEDHLLLSDGSAALAGWPNPYNNVFPPKLTRVLTSEFLKVKLEKLTSLFYDYSFAQTKQRISKDW